VIFFITTAIDAGKNKDQLLNHRVMPGVLEKRMNKLGKQVDD
jgi:hypothetical protein